MHKKLTFRRTLSKEELLAAYNLVKKSDWGSLIDLNKFYLQSRKTRCFGIFMDKELIGFFRVLTDGVYLAYVMDLIINPKFQSQGFGTETLLYIENRFSPLKIILMSSNAQKFYLKNGYSRVRKQDNYFVKITQNNKRGVLRPA